MKVLVVDDSAAQRMIVKAIANNYEGVTKIDEATDGTRALELLRNEEYQIIFTDINMEPMSGLELIAKTKEENISGRFAFITSHLTTSMEEKVKQAGGEFYITKPITQEKIEDILKQVING